MKAIISLTTFLILHLNSFGQIFEVEFYKHLGFNTSKHWGYEEIINTENMLTKEFSSGDTNKYVFDIEKKEISLYHNGTFIAKEDLLTYKKEKGLIYITMSDEELSSGEEVISTIVINTDKTDTLHPRLTIYCLSPSNDLTNGYMTID
jgi:hypothetical protein